MNTKVETITHVNVKRCGKSSEKFRVIFVYLRYRFENKILCQTNLTINQIPCCCDTCFIVEVTPYRNKNINHTVKMEYDRLDVQLSWDT